MEQRAVIVRAPVRISFGGGGTDLEAYYGRFGGFVVSAAITRYVYVVARPSADGGIQLTSADYGLWQHWAPGQLPPVEPPLALPKAAVERFAGYGLLERGVELTVASEVPPGTGLGSSSAVAAGLVAALTAYLDEELTPGEIAEEACRLEIERLAMPIGKQDQYASAIGGLNAIRFSADGVAVEPLALPEPLRHALSERLLLFSTGRSRNSADILGEQRRDTGVKPLVIEALHRIKALALEMRGALATGELDDFGHLLDIAWAEKKRLSGRISSAAIDDAYAAARAAGALGGKITGAGGGGFLLLYCPPADQPGVRAALRGLGLTEMAFGLSDSGVEVLSGAAHWDMSTSARLPVLGD